MEKSKQKRLKITRTLNEENAETLREGAFILHKSQGAIPDDLLCDYKIKPVFKKYPINGFYSVFFCFNFLFFCFTYINVP